MSGRSTGLSIRDFTNKATIDLPDYQCTLHNLMFRKQDFWKDYQIKEILDICKKYTQPNMNTLIVKNEDKLILWIEEKEEKTPSQLIGKLAESQDISATGVSTNNQ